MTFDIQKSLEILSKTPLVLESLLVGLSNEWLRSNEGENTWSPYDVLGHLIHGEKTDWVVRAKIMLSNVDDKTFKPFDRFAQISENQECTIDELLSEFKNLRASNLEIIKTLQISDSHLDLKGIHPELGQVTLKELLATWVVHDLGHLSQITRVMAKQYESEVGPWKAYLGILQK